MDADIIEREYVDQELEKIRKGKQGISDAMRKLDLTRTALKQFDSVDEQIKNLKKMIDKLNEKFYFIPSKVEIEKDNRLLYEKVTNEMKNYVKRRFGSLKEELIGKADKMVVDKMQEEKAQQFTVDRIIQEIREMNVSKIPFLHQQIDNLATKTRLQLKGKLEKKDIKGTMDEIVKENLIDIQSQIDELQLGVEEKSMSQSRYMAGSPIYMDSVDIKQEELDQVVQRDQQQFSQESKVFKSFDSQNISTSATKDNLWENKGTLSSTPTYFSSQNHLKDRIPSIAETGKVVVNPKQPNKINVRGQIVGLQREIQDLKDQLDRYIINFDLNKQKQKQQNSKIQKLFKSQNTAKENLDKLHQSQDKLQQSILKEIQEKTVEAAKNHNSNVMMQINRIKQDMSNYTKRIVNIETNFNEMYRDHKFTKKTFKDKINEVIGLCENLGQTRQKMLKKIQKQSLTLQNYQIQTQERLNTISQDLYQVKDPLLEMISNQSQENEILQVTVQQQNAKMREIVDDYVRSHTQSINSSSIGDSSAIYIDRLNRRFQGNSTPRVQLNSSLRLQFSTPRRGRLSGDSVIQFHEDGKRLKLPRVKY